MIDKKNKKEPNKESKEELDRYERIVDRAHKEIEKAHSAYHTLMYLFSAFFVLIIGAVAVLSWKTVNDMGERHDKIFEYYGNTLERIDSRLNREVDTLQRQVKSRIDEEFKTEKIQKLIEEKAKEHTQKAVAKYISTEVNDVIVPLKNEMEKTINQAHARLDSIEQLFTINTLCDTAITGARDSYAELQNIVSGTPKLSVYAKSKIMRIHQTLHRYRNTPPMYKTLYATKNDKQVSYEKLSLDKIVKNMSSHSFPHEYRQYCMVYIKTKPKEEVFEKALEVLKTSKSLPTCAAFCGVLSEISDEKAEFLDFDSWIKICQKQLSKK